MPFQFGFLMHAWGFSSEQIFLGFSRFWIPNLANYLGWHFSNLLYSWYCIGIAWQMHPLSFWHKLRLWKFFRLLKKEYLLLLHTYRLYACSVNGNSTVWHWGLLPPKKGHTPILKCLLRLANRLINGLHHLPTKLCFQRLRTERHWEILIILDSNAIYDDISNAWIQSINPHLKLKLPSSKYNILYRLLHLNDGWKKLQETSNIFHKAFSCCIFF